MLNAQGKVARSTSLTDILSRVDVSTIALFENIMKAILRGSTTYYRQVRLTTSSIERDGGVQAIFSIYCAQRG